MDDSAIRRFVPRATRYVLRPQDQKLLRFAFQQDHLGQGIQETVLFNLSKTGLAFLVEREFAPALGDLIKVDFSVPGRQRLASWARVVRTEEYSRGLWWLKENPRFSDFIMVGISFQDLPVGHEMEIQTGLDQRLTELFHEHRKEQIRRLWQWFQYRGWKVTAFLAAAVCVFWSLYLLSRPSDNYDPRRGSPWGERFHIFK
jgi:hypothetical protein